LAKLLKAGMIPKASIYPKATRPIRDLRRQRSRLVALRAAAYGRLRRLRLRHGLLRHARHDITQTADDDRERWLAHPLLRLHGHQELERIDLYTQQIATLEPQILATVHDRPALRRLLTIPGLGKILAMTIVYAIGAMARFQKARDLASYGRLVPGVAQSGPVSRRGRHAKPGSPPLTWAFSQAALDAVRYYPKSQRGVDRHLARHRGKTGELIADESIAHTLAQAVYHVLRDGAVYREELLFRT
jgi:transposase